jgi:hypothetical protein
MRVAVRRDIARGSGHTPVPGATVQRDKEETRPLLSSVGPRMPPPR